MSAIIIKSVNVTTLQDETWGRLYIQYEIDGQLYFIFKNWLKSKEHTFKGLGDLLTEPSYSWFKESNRNVYTDVEFVKSGYADNLLLSPEKYKEKFGTPSKILKRLLIELRANFGEPVEMRRGWFNTLPKGLVISPVLVKPNLQIWLPAYETEVKLDFLHKTVYLLFLKHPEGIILNQMDTYKEEIENLYKSLRPDGTKTKLKKSVENLTKIDDNSLNEKFSKIKKYLLNELGEVIAETYIIRGVKNKLYRINLSTDLITFQ